jgi:hypothetical protein
MRNALQFFPLIMKTPSYLASFKSKEQVFVPNDENEVADLPISDDLRLRKYNTNNSLTSVTSQKVKKGWKALLEFFKWK